MAEASERLLELRPVTFRYRKAFRGGEKPLQFGLIAEEVAQVFPELVVYDERGEPETVKYHLLTSLLLNEVQKLHRMNGEQAQRLARLEELEGLDSKPPRVARAAADRARSSPEPSRK